MEYKRVHYYHKNQLYVNAKYFCCKEKATLLPMCVLQTYAALTVIINCILWSLYLQYNCGVMETVISLVVQLI